MKVIKIVIPVYKTEKHLERCINSVIRQTERNFELVLVDDGSPDRCPQICDRFEDLDSRIHVIHMEHRGLSAARNAGMDYGSDCKYLAFIDSDDWIHPRYLEMLLKAIRETGCPMSIAAHVKTGGRVDEVEIKDVQPAVYSAEESYCLKTISTTPAWGKLFETGLFDSIRFPVGRIHEDYYTMWKALFRARKTAVVKEPLYYYYVNTEGIMRSSWTPERMDLFPALKEKIMFFQENGYYKAKARAVTKMNLTAGKYIKRIEDTPYAEEFIPQLIELQEWCRDIQGGCDSPE